MPYRMTDDSVTVRGKAQPVRYRVGFPLLG